MIDAVQFFKSDLDSINDRQSVTDIIRATDQFRVVAFGKTRKFQAIELRRKNNAWQAQDSDGKWYTSFWCEM